MNNNEDEFPDLFDLPDPSVNGDGDTEPLNRTPVETAGKPDNTHLALTDTGLAERFARHHRANVRYCHPWRTWIAYDSTRWKLDDVGSVEYLAKRTARSILVEAAHEEDKHLRSSLTNFARSSESATRRAAMLKLAQCEKGIPILPEALDRNPYLLNCGNGTIDLQTGTLRPHDRSDLITKLCPVQYHPAATCPLWMRFLDHIFGSNQSLIDFVQRVFGLCLTGDVSEQVLLVYHGVGANGKSVLLNTQLALMGTDYAMQAPPDLLMEKRGDSHPTERADLHGKRLVCSIETEDGRRLAESLVKSLTGGDRVRARRMKENFWEFSPTHKLILACNHRPIVKGTDHGLWRRIRLVPFNVVIQPHEQDKALAGKLRDELPGILAWAVRGCLDWQRHGLGEPAAVIEATASYRTEQDALAEFLAERCSLDANTYERASRLFAAYRDWAGDKNLTQRRFGKAMTERGFERFPNNGVCYRGIRLNDVEGELA